MALFDRARSVLARAVDDGAMPGVAVSVWQGGDLAWEMALGTTDGAAPATLDTRYDLASLTKPLATASSVLSLVERGELLLGQCVDEFLGAKARALSQVTIRHLLTHTSGLPAWTACYENGAGLDAAVDAIVREPVSALPGGRYTYSCLGFILLAKIIETVTGATLDRFARETIFVPQNLSTLTFRPNGIPVAPTVSREGPGRDSPLTGVVHDGNARGIEAGGESVSGNAGLFGTVSDVARFGEKLRRGEIFGAPATARALCRQTDPNVGGHTLLFFSSPNPLTPAGELLSELAVGHSGFTGTLLLIDPAYAITVALTSNAVFGDGKDAFLRYRRRFLNALAADITSTQLTV